MPTNDPVPSLTATAILLTDLLTLLLPLNAYKWSNSFSNGHCYSTYSPINSAASPECLTNDPTPSLTATSTLLTALLTLLLPLNAYKWSNSFSNGHCYSTYSPTNSACCFRWMPTNDQIPFLTATATLLTALLTLLLPLNSCKWSNSWSNGHCYSTYSLTNSAASPECLHPIPSLTATATLPIVLLTLLLPLNAYKWSNSFSNDHCYSSYSPTNSAASPECLQMIRFLL
jgi:hypothetical protein